MVQIKEFFYKIPFLPIFLFAYFGIVFSGKYLLVVLLIHLVLFLLFIFLKFYEFLPLLIISLIFFFYTKNLSDSGNFIVGRVDSVGSNSVLILVENIKNEIIENWKVSGGYIRVFGIKNLGEFDTFDKVVIYCSYVKELRAGWRICFNPKFFEKMELSFPLSFLREMRNRARSFVRGDDEESKILDSILFAGREDIDQKFLYDLSRFGILHLIAISGSHFTAVAFLGIFLASFLARYIYSVRFQPYVLKIILSLIFQLLFLFMCGMVRPAVRAFLMNTIFFTTYLSGRSFSPINNLFASGFFIILFNPFDVWNISFLLSFFSVLFLISFVDFHGSKVFLTFWSSVFASLGVLPICIWIGMPVSLVAPLTNIVFTSLFNFVILFGVFGVFLGFIFEPLSEIPILVSKYIIKLIIFLVDVFGYLGISVNPKLDIPYEFTVIFLLFVLLGLKRLREFFPYISLVIYLIVPTFLHFQARQKIFTFSVFVIKEIRGTEGKSFYVLPLRRNISHRNLSELENFLNKSRAMCSVLCFEESNQIGDIPVCESYQCDFGNIRN